MKIWWKSFQVAFTYIGTIVGAGFASGREVMQFFTRFGALGPFLIAISVLFFIGIGAKIMLLAAEIRARSYEDLNTHLFGQRAGKVISQIMLVVLLAVNAVMLAGAGTIFSENWHMNYQFGMLVTIFVCYLLLLRGMSGILAVNSLVVPLMILFAVILLAGTLAQGAETLLSPVPPEHFSPLAAWLSPFLYAAFNLAMAQAVLVPLGSQIGDERILKRGAWMGGIGIGLLLMAGHFIMSARLPEIARFDIPMAQVAREFGAWIHLFYVILIFSEIYTTMVADIYGLTAQIAQRTRFSRGSISAALLMICFLVGQFGFGPLLSTLYPLFGFFSLIWLYLMIRDRTLENRQPPVPPAGQLPQTASPGRSLPRHGGGK
jgi:uncharacterized membrane protein YkvI